MSQIRQALQDLRAPSSRILGAWRALAIRMFASNVYTGGSDELACSDLNTETRV
jgi:hypothetical protein